jgi:acetyl esterase/lipase
MLLRILGPLLSFGLVAPSSGLAQDVKDTKKDDKAAETKPPVPPTAGNVAYGPLERQVLDFFQAKSDKPTPLVFCIHGGGWVRGDKSNYYIFVKSYLDNGISVVTINYRFISQAVEQKVTPPVKAPLEDAARALQFVRSKAAEWNIDKTRIGATGGSAGGFSALWLAFHDDMADPKSNDPVARESTRVYCAAVDSAQVSLDPKEVREWLPNYTYGALAFGMRNLDNVEKNREVVTPWLKEYSPINLVTKDDPPIGLYYGGVKGAKVGESHPDAVHSPILGLKLAEKLKATGVEVVFRSSSEPDVKPASTGAFLIEKLKK